MHKIQNGGNIFNPQLSLTILDGKVGENWLNAYGIVPCTFTCQN